MRSIELDSGIKEIEVKNKRGVVQTIIRVDVNDVDGMKKIASVITDLRNLSAECQAEVERKKQECREMDKYQMAVVASELRIKYLNKVIGRIDGIFGADTVKNVFQRTTERTRIIHRMNLHSLIYWISCSRRLQSSTRRNLQRTARNTAS